MSKVGTVLETDKWKIKIYAPPREHGPPHVHVILKGSKLEVKINLRDLEIMGHTHLSKRAAKEIVRYVHENYDFLMDCWEKLHG